jgi:hypothetical protein
MQNYNTVVSTLDNREGKCRLALYLAEMLGAVVSHYTFALFPAS